MYFFLEIVGTFISWLPILFENIVEDIINICYRNGMLDLSKPSTLYCYIHILTTFSSYTEWKVKPDGL